MSASQVTDRRALVRAEVERLLPDVVDPAQRAEVLRLLAEGREGDAHSVAVVATTTRGQR